MENENQKYTSAQWAAWNNFAIKYYGMPLKELLRSIGKTDIPLTKEGEADWKAIQGICALMEIGQDEKKQKNRGFEFGD